MVDHSQNNQFFRVKIPYDVTYVDIDPDRWLLQKTDYVIDCPPFNIDIGNDTSFCEGDSLFISANVGIGNYLWNDSSSSTYSNSASQNES